MAQYYEESEPGPALVHLRPQNCNEHHYQVYSTIPLGASVSSYPFCHLFKPHPSNLRLHHINREIHCIHMNPRIKLERQRRGDIRIQNRFQHRRLDDDVCRIIVPVTTICLHISISSARITNARRGVNLPILLAEAVPATASKNRIGMCC
jgi:hypothetical protein